MTRKRKLIAFTLMLALLPIFLGEKKTNASTEIALKGVTVQMSYINKHSIISDNKGIKYIGHRGIEGLAPENTLPAFELAGKLGFWGAECDARTTSDGNWIILHDDTVNRMTNGSGKIKNLTFKEVQSLKIDSGKNIDNYKGIKVLKLEDYLLTCKKWGMVPIIDMKPADNIKHYDKFIKIVKKYGNIEKTVVISSSNLILSELRKRNSYLTLGYLCSDITNSNIYFVKTLGNAFINSSFSNITRNKVNVSHENNIKVGAWTVDNKVLADSLIEKGVDYLTTNKLLPDGKKQEVVTN